MNISHGEFVKMSYIARLIGQAMNPLMERLRVLSIVHGCEYAVSLVKLCLSLAQNAMWNYDSFK